jgi:hypothetical protein
MEQHYRTPLKSISRHTREKALNNFEKTIEDLSEGLPVIDKEMIHIRADQALLDYLKGIGHEEVVEKYLELIKKSDGFWYA